MAGTIPSLSMSTQFDNATGQPMVGGKLYFYAANTTTPQNAYKDTALTLAHPNPITLDGAGRVPEFYVADGTIHIRLTNSAGVIQLDAQNTLVLGPSGGGGGSPSSVDPTTIFQTGDELFVKIQSPRPGWVRQNGNTIGNPTSGATERANADTQALFTYLWTNFTNSKNPVIGGRGASAAADFAASKQITLPDMRGRGAIGLDDMGATAAGVLQASNVTSAGDGVTTAAATGGEANHTLSTGEMPSHNHALTDTGHTHSFTASVNNGTASASPGTGNYGLPASSGTTGSSQTGISLAATGGGTAHNNMHPFALGTWYMKL